MTAERAKPREDIAPEARKPKRDTHRLGQSLGLRVEGEMTDFDAQWLERKLAIYGMKAPNGAKNLTKIVSGKMLWNYDNLEPSEKKLVL